MFKNIPCMIILFAILNLSIRNMCALDDQRQQCSKEYFEKRYQEIENKRQDFIGKLMEDQNKITQRLNDASVNQNPEVRLISLLSFQNKLKIESSSLSVEKLEIFRDEELKLIEEIATCSSLFLDKMYHEMVELSEQL